MESLQFVYTRTRSSNLNKYIPNNIILVYRFLTHSLLSVFCLRENYELFRLKNLSYLKYEFVLHVYEVYLS